MNVIFGIGDNNTVKQRKASETRNWTTIKVLGTSTEFPFEPDCLNLVARFLYPGQRSRNNRAGLLCEFLGAGLEDSETCFSRLSRAL